MNRIYRLVFSSTLRALVAVSEITKGRSKGGGKSAVVGMAVSAALVVIGLTMAEEAGAVDWTSGDYLVNGTISHPSISDGLTASGATVGSLAVENFSQITGSSLGVLIGSSNLAGGVVNSGTISGANIGISISNSLISRAITNKGSIAGDSGIGIFMLSSVVSGGITNSGNIVGSVYGIGMTASTLTDGVINNGIIRGALTGIDLRSSSLIGGIVNNGTISGGNVGDGIVLQFGSSLRGGITNKGEIVSGPSGNAIFLNSSSLRGGIINSGSIIGGQKGIALSNVSSMSEGINNSGVISGGQKGVDIRSGSVLAGGIVNSGVIKGLMQGLVASSSSIVGGITNSGVIKGGSRGIYVGTNSIITGGITNSGLISGAVNSIYVEGSSSLDNIVIAGNNTASFSGAVDAPNTTVTVASSATYTLDTKFNVNNFVNAGTLIVPTASIATPVISGALTLQNGGTFIPTISSINNYAQVAVTGDVNIGGALVINSPMMPVGSTLTGLITGNTVSGAFTSTSDNSYLYNYVPIYTGMALNLVVARDASTSFTQAVQGNNNSAGVGGAGVLDGMSGNPNSAMASVMSSFGQMKTAQQVSNAVSQTLPVIMGAASQAAAQSQQGLNQIMQGRQNQLRGLSSGDEFIGTRDVWMKGYGSWANQDSVNNVSGYKVNTGGLAVGIDRQLSPKSNIGAVFAFGNSSVSSNNSAAPSGITVNSYQIGAYGDYALQHDWQANYQADIGLNNNKSYRNLSDFGGVQDVGSNANANYNSTVAHLGAGLRHFVPLAENTTFIPSIRADYTTVQSQGYTESGGGALNLNVNSQSYNMMMFSADLRLDHELTDKLRVSANVGGGYNALNNQVQITSAYQGGGSAFATNGLQVSPWLYNAGLGIAGRIDKNTELNVRYDTQFTTTSYTNQIVSAKLKFWY